MSGKSFPIKYNVNDKLVSGKPSGWLHTVIHPLYLYLGLRSIFRSISFKTAAPKNVTAHASRKRVLKYDCTVKCHKINISCPFWHILFYVILNISYMQACTIELSSLPNDSMQSLFLTKSRFFSGILTAHFKGKSFSIYMPMQVTVMHPRDFTDPRGQLAMDRLKTQQHHSLENF